MEHIDPKRLRKTLNRLVRRGPIQKAFLMDGPSVEDLLLRSPQLAPGSAHADPVNALGTRWRAVCMPLWMDWRFKREWDLFLVLEVGFFFPYRHRYSPPANLGQIGVLLSDREHLAAVIADGDRAQAVSLLHPRHDSFWLSIVPISEAMPYTTVKSRLERAMAILAVVLEADPQPCLMGLEQRP